MAQLLNAIHKNLGPVLDMDPNEHERSYIVTIIKVKDESENAYLIMNALYTMTPASLAIVQDDSIDYDKRHACVNAHTDLNTHAYVIALDLLLEVIGVMDISEIASDIARLRLVLK